MGSEQLKEKKEYRSSFGATILFSGVQVYQIIIRIVRSKFVALFIGPTGLGISSLLRSTTDLISAATNLGLKTSGVKAVSAANADDDKNTIAKTIVALRRLVVLTGLFGAALCAILSPIWSQTSFHNTDYTIAFIIVSLTILFDQLNNGEIVLLQGLQKKRFLARVNLIGQTIGLVLTIPLYYFFRLKAIPWVLVLSSVLTYVITKLYTRKVELLTVKVSFRETFIIGKDMIKLGIFLSFQLILSYLSTFLLRSVVSKWGGLDDVGLYSAGITIVNVYLGLVFAAISTDYFPRLAATKSNEELGNVISRQAVISILLFLPIVVAFIIFIKPVILLLYSEKFIPIEGMIYWAIGATVIKALAWSMSYSTLAKASPSFFFYNELVATIYCTFLQVAGYYFGGLTGVGIAILVGYCMYLIHMLIITNKCFGFSVNKEIWKLFIWGNLGISCSVLIRITGIHFSSYWLLYGVGGIFLLLVFIIAFRELNRKLDLIGLFHEKMHKKDRR